MRFADKVVIVTGAASGIGLAAAARFAEEGASLVLSDIDMHKLEAATAPFGLGPKRLRLLKVDAGVPAEQDGLIAAAVEAFGGIDVLVNNAGIGAFGYVTEVTPDLWDKVISVTLGSVFYASRAALPHLILRRGSIVNTASISGLVGDIGFAAYNAAKGGVVNLTRAMAVDHARDSVRVNAICPGITETGLVTWMHKHPAIVAGFEEGVPMGRMARPEEMAGAIAFLASEDASYITGINLVVDGGLTAHTGQPPFRRLIDSID